MTREQLLCPMVLHWGPNFRKKLEESHVSMTKEERLLEFDKWFDENIDAINESISNKNNKLNEKLDKIYFDEFDLEDVEKASTEDTEEGETLTGAHIFKLDNKNNDDTNIYKFIDDFYDNVQSEHIENDTHEEIMSKLDVSSVKDMTALFAFTNLPNIDLSSWDTHNVEHMEGMFYRSTFNNPSICRWDVSSCDDFKNMFLFCNFHYSLKFWSPKMIEKSQSDGTSILTHASLPVIGAVEDEQTSVRRKERAEIFDKLRKSAKESTSAALAEESYVMDFETFVNEGKVKDFINKGIEKVKDVFRAIELKFGDIVAFFKKDGSYIPAMSPYSSINMISNGKINGVTAYCGKNDKNLNDNVKTVADVVKSPEYYGIIEKDSIEYKNYQTFCQMINEHYEKYGNVGNFDVINEDYPTVDDLSPRSNTDTRIPLHAKSAAVMARDITTKSLTRRIKDILEFVPGNIDDDTPPSGTLFIWGAPGIGKSTIPSAVINAWNESQEEQGSNLRKALMVIQCGDLSVDGMSLPMPEDISIDTQLELNPTMKKYIEDMGIDMDKNNNVLKQKHIQVVDAPKTWLPVFKKTRNTEERKIRNAIANGYSILKKNHGETEVIPTTEGGILMFDEFFRANENVFSTMMQICLNRSFGDWDLGDKWAILCCSNRPSDDAEVFANYKSSAGTTIGNRFGAGIFNFVPSFSEWREWAVKHGNFDDATLDFLTKEKETVDGEIEYTNWHNVKPGRFYQFGEMATVTPRSWTMLMDKYQEKKKKYGYKSILDIPVDEFVEDAAGIIGEDMAHAYNTHMDSFRKSSVDVGKIMNDSTYTIKIKDKDKNDSVITVCKKVLGRIKADYSPKELPSVDNLMNIFNFFSKHYGVSQDNVVKGMHIDIIDYLTDNSVGAFEKMRRNEYGAYISSVDAKYDLDKYDLGCYAKMR